MKKTYITPEASAYIISTASHILSGSPLDIAIDNSATTYEGSQALTGEEKASTNVWGEEW